MKKSEIKAYANTMRAKEILNSENEELRERLKELHEALKIHYDNDPERIIYISPSRIKGLIDFMDTFLYD